MSQLYVVSIEKAGSNWIWDAGRIHALAESVRVEPNGDLALIFEGKVQTLVSRRTYASYRLIGPYRSIYDIPKDPAVNAQFRAHLKEIIRIPERARGTV